jgi:hypothetical protein
MAGSARISLIVSEGTIPNGTEVTVTTWRGVGDSRQVRVMGYIAHTDAYLCDTGDGIQAFLAQNVLRAVPKFTSVEEADAWLEGR